MNKKPNILIFMTDQQRGDSLTNSAVKTPFMDEYRKEALTFSEAYCPSPHCCPSRATFFTGLYPSQHGVWNNVNVANAISRGPYEDITLFSQSLSDVGYNLTFDGKWHVDGVKRPSDFGFEDGLVTAARSEKASDIFRRGEEREVHANWKRYKTCEVHTKESERNPGSIKRIGYPNYEHYGTDENPFNDIGVTDSAIANLKKRQGAETPWCHYIGLLGPHDPYKVPQKYKDMYDLSEIKLPENYSDLMKDKPAFYQRTRRRFDQLTEKEQKEALLHYYAFCTFLDDQFRRVILALREIGEEENTIVVFLSDHGDYNAEHGLWCKGLPPFRGAYNIPCVIKWPAGIKNPGRITDEFISLADFAPTFLEMTGACVKNSAHYADGSEVKMVGRSLVPFFTENHPAEWRKELYTQSNGNELYGIQRMVFDKKFKFVFNGFDWDELYDLVNDPGETVNLICEGEEERLQKYGEVIAHYQKKIWQFAYETGDQYNNPYIMISFPEVGPGAIFG